jgi:hypothetical protein
MSPEDSSRNGKRKLRELCGLMARDDLRQSPSKYGEAQVSARRTGVTSLNMHETGANLGHLPLSERKTGEHPVWRL